ncbi:MAG: aldehyde dehydrogenase family protein, partial [Sediminibacterium sp.]|nr:aldehyde dehydrogenase family protein [Sediminibacterium sp.]
MEFLKQLGVVSQNEGVSTGTQWIISKGAIINSFSPVDGKQIGTVTTADHPSYELVMAKAQ